MMIIIKMIVDFVNILYVIIIIDVDFGWSLKVFSF